MTSPTITTALLGAAQAGEDAAWVVIHQAWAPIVLDRCVRRRAIDPEAVTAEVFFRLWRRIERVQDAEHFPRFLYQMTRKVLAEERRRAWFKRWVGGFSQLAFVAVPDAAPTPERGAVLSETTRQVFALLDILPELQREAVVLCDVEGHKTAEAAALRGLKLSTFKTQLRRGRLHFRALAAERGLHFPEDTDA